MPVPPMDTQCPVGPGPWNDLFRRPRSVPYRKTSLPGHPSDGPTFRVPIAAGDRVPPTLHDLVLRRDRWRRRDLLAFPTLRGAACFSRPDYTPVVPVPEAPRAPTLSAVPVGSRKVDLGVSRQDVYLDPSCPLRAHPAR